MAESWVSTVAAAITGETGHDFTPRSVTPVGGGCINEAFLLTGNDCDYFVKLNRAEAGEMFSAEAHSLRVLAGANSLRVPRPVASGRAGQHAFLALEAIRFGPPPQDWSAMGAGLAALHRVTAPRFGWAGDNFLGDAPQPNAWTDDWAVFFRDQRLRPQFARAARRHAPLTGADRLLEAVETLLAGHRPAPSLLHGDLWGGNAAHDEHGAPVIYDPACYYGDRETDLAFTRLFGGFPESFYRAYAQAWPLPPGHERRTRLYNLYHLVNHANLFGGGYHAQAEAVIRSLTGRLR